MDLAEEKASQLRQRMISRDNSNGSILDRMNLREEEKPNYEHRDDDEVKLEDRPDNCTECKGKGKVKTLFSTVECFHCDGTGFDLSNPVKIIKWQSLCMQWAAKKIRQQKLDLYFATTTEEERTADSVSAFYKGTRRTD